MGLDMYLSRRSYVRNFDHMKPEELHKITVKKGGKTRTDIKPERVSAIVEELAYWRKFNALHRWFVDNVQGGVDNCGEYFVDHNDFEKLRLILKEVIEKRGQMEQNILVAAKLLPTQDGFFFGAVDYDDHYYKMVEYTLKVVEEAINDTEHTTSYYYKSSW